MTFVTGDISKRLLDLARDDEAAARGLLTLDGISEAIVGFHCQQAVEKALKAALASRDVKFPHTHDLVGLSRLCRESGLDLPEDLRQEIRHLAPYGVLARYGPVEGDRLDGAQAVRYAALAIEWASAIERSHETRDPWRSRSEHDQTDRSDR